MGVPAPEARGGVSAASSCARKVTCLESWLALPRAERLRPAADAERLSAAASPPCHPDSGPAPPADADSPGPVGLDCLAMSSGERRLAPTSPRGPSDVGAAVADGVAEDDAGVKDDRVAAPAERLRFAGCPSPGGTSGPPAGIAGGKG